jgi:hypothetical protein
VLRRAAGDGGQRGEGVRLEVCGSPWRRDAEHQRRLQHRVVQEEVVDRAADQVVLLSQVVLAQAGDPRLEGRPVHAPGPGLLEGPLQLAAGADAWISD